MRTITVSIPAALWVTGTVLTVACSNGERGAEDAGGPDMVTAVASLGDSVTGRGLFVSKSCVLCHSVRGVGGKVAPPLDVLDESRAPTEMEFIANIWRGAPIMVELQQIQIGYQIDMSGDDLRHLAAFGTDPAVQETFTLAEVPMDMRNLFVDQIYMDAHEDLQDRYQGEEYQPPGGPQNE